eukprot:CAMPEP_0176426388 /NCGR_PEP_ID=MMETSP0127-20121128/11913_1 /TAXON_ID=938130 /ORGANISM="Platyophrya macrostoma, Strain WH" /LENGTH=153 /DNA_ID=CAMNT_0017807647 /DNA_START=41 /DNA_END=498 /DNA_ORIENTATION=+
MSRLYRGDRIVSLRRTLPPNLVVFDGKCRLSQHRISQVIERNFPLVLDESFQPRCLYFTSSQLPEGREVLRAFPHLSIAAKDGAASGSTSSSLSPPSSSSRRWVDSVVLVERVPSAEGRLQRLNPLRKLGTMDLDAPVSDTDDVMVYTKWKAV